MGLLRRYKSEIYGRYRKAYLRDGVYTGVFLSVVVLFMKLIYYPIAVPHTLYTDLALLVATFFFGYRYRQRLPEAKVFFKELMLYGLGLGIVAAVVYGLFLMLYGSVIDADFPHRCWEQFVNNERNGAGTPEEKEQTIAVMQTYTVVTWALIGAFLTAVMSIMTAFVMALVLRTENNIVRPKK